MILKKEVRGVITSIPPKRVTLRGSINTAAIAMRRPRAAANEHRSVAVRGPKALVGGFPDDTLATAMPCLLVSPIVSTATALITTTASGHASLSSWRYDIVEASKLILEISSLLLPA